MLKLSGAVMQKLVNKKTLIGLLVVVVAGAGGFYLFGGSKKAESSYITQTVQKGTISNAISASGTIEPVDTISLSFENAEIIKKLYVKVGDHVTAGELLAEEDTANLQASVTQATASVQSATSNLELTQNSTTPEQIAQSEASVSSAEASYELAKANLERNQQLLDAGGMTQADFDQTKSQYTSAAASLQNAQASLAILKAGKRPEEIAAAAAQVASSRAQLATAQRNLAGAKMYSPMNGIVSVVNGAEGQRATANNNNTSGGGFINIISETLQVRAQINESDMGKLKVGQQAEFTVDAFPNQTFTGQVNSISPQAYTQSNVQLYDAIIQLTGDQTGLLAGMPANVSIIVQRQQDVVVVPKGAVTFGMTYLSSMRQNGEQNGGAAQHRGNGANGGTNGANQANGGPSGGANGANSGAGQAGGANGGPSGGTNGANNGAGQAGGANGGPSSGANGANSGAGQAGGANGGPSSGANGANNGAGQAGQGNGGANGANGSHFGSGNGGGAGNSGNGNQQGVVVVLDQSKQPVVRHVVLGLSDLTNYEVVSGLNEGETVVVGSLAQNTGLTSSQGQGQNGQQGGANRMGGGMGGMGGAARIRIGG